MTLFLTPKTCHIKEVGLYLNPTFYVQHHLTMRNLHIENYSSLNESQDLYLVADKIVPHAYIPEISA